MAVVKRCGGRGLSLSRFRARRSEFSALSSAHPAQPSLLRVIERFPELFRRGNWAIVGLVKESLDAFKTNLEDRMRMIAVSQLAASAITRHLNTDSLGINPFSAPRLDEQQSMVLDHERYLVQYATTKQERRSDQPLQVPSGRRQKECG
jgi:hypothetical protein